MPPSRGADALVGVLLTEKEWHLVRRLGTKTGGILFKDHLFSFTPVRKPAVRCSPVKGPLLKREL